MKRPTSTGSSNGNSPKQQSSLNSYQHGGSSSYQPPVFYAADQTRVLEDTTKQMYETDDTAGRVLSQMTQQRQQIVGADNDVVQMNLATAKAKTELDALKQKYRQRKLRLYGWIVLLGIADALLFLRLIQCHGNFYCI